MKIWFGSHGAGRAARAGLAGLLLAAGGAGAVPEFWIEDLGTLGGTNSEAKGINDHSQVVGWAHDANGRIQAFLWDKGTMTGLGFLTNRWSNSVAMAINNQGEITGYSSVSATNEHAFYYADDTLTDIGTPGSPDSVGRAINPSGAIAGSAPPSNNVTINYSFFWRTNRFIQIPSFNNFNSCDAFGLNNAGQVCGNTFLWATDGRWWGYVWQDANTNGMHDSGEMKVLGSLGTIYSVGSQSAAFAINDIGQAVGYTGITNTWNPNHAFLVTASNGQWKIPAGGPDPANVLMQDLGTLGDRSLDSYAYAINNYSWVVGTSATAADTNAAFLWRNGVMTNLNDLIPPGSGWVLTNATGINAHNEIVGSGLFHGVSKAFLLRRNGRIITFSPLVETNFFVYTNELEEVVTQVTEQVTGQLVQWSGVWGDDPYAAHVFTVESCDTLHPGSWAPAVPAAQWPIPGSFWTNSDLQSVSARFFRVRAAAAP